jgi:hypothetical protein
MQVNKQNKAHSPRNRGILQSCITFFFFKVESTNLLLESSTGVLLAMVAVGGVWVAGFWVAVMEVVMVVLMVVLVVAVVLVVVVVVTTVEGL